MTGSGTFTQLGLNTRGKFLQQEEGKIALEFVTGTGGIKAGQPVKIATDGTIVAWAKTDLQHKLLGFAYTDGAVGDYVTVITRGFAIQWGITSFNGATNAQEATFNGYDSTHDPGDGILGWNTWGAMTDVTDMVAWILDPTTAQYGYSRILLKD
jgi:hypothetical protein